MVRISGGSHPKTQLSGKKNVRNYDEGYDLHCVSASSRQGIFILYLDGFYFPICRLVRNFVVVSLIYLHCTFFHNSRNEDFFLYKENPILARVHFFVHYLLQSIFNINLTRIAQTSNIYVISLMKKVLHS